MIILVLLALFSTFFLGVLSKTQFIRPPAAGTPGDNPVYCEGDEVELMWEKDIQLIDIYVWRQNYSSPGGDNVYQAITTNTSLSSYPWIVSGSVEGPIPDGETRISWLSMYRASTNGPIAESHYFNVRAKKSSGTASTTTTTAEVYVRTTSSISTSTSTSTPTKTSESGPCGSHTLSTGAVAGIAVGATLGGIFLLAGVVLTIWRCARGSKTPCNSRMDNGKYLGPQTASPDTAEHRSELEARTYLEAPGYGLFRP